MGLHRPQHVHAFLVHSAIIEVTVQNTFGNNGWKLKTGLVKRIITTINFLSPYITTDLVDSALKAFVL